MPDVACEAIRVSLINGIALDPYVLKMRTARNVPRPWLCRNTMISGMTLCSAHPEGALEPRLADAVDLE
jgi:hypothetical protein